MLDPALTACSYRGAGACPCARSNGLEAAVTGADAGGPALWWDELADRSLWRSQRDSWSGNRLLIAFDETVGRFVLADGDTRLACVLTLKDAMRVARVHDSAPERLPLKRAADTYPDQTGDELNPLIRARAFIAASRWTFASTMPEIPHEYTVKHRFAPPAEFDWMVLQIRAHGFEAAFYDRTFMYWIVDDHKYWTMGAPADETTVINREHVDPAVRQRQRDVGSAP